MASPTGILQLLTHPAELRAIIQWKLWHQAVHERDECQESKNLRRCFYFLDFTSRSFATVIKELHPELLVPVCIFYLILRGLDTIEDDMTIPLDVKLPILRGFDSILRQEGWTFDGNHSREKDRDLLVEFDCVIAEFAKIKEAFQNIILDITKRMGQGMAHYCENAELNINGLSTVEEYEKYCHYVAGLVGEGCTRLFVEAKLANPALLERPELTESMGQFLQQTNIIRDIKEDFDDKRRFWPRQIWSKHVAKFEYLFKPENRTAALNCNSDMILNALSRADDCLLYLAGIREQSVFNFCAIPQTMAIATLNLCFRNYSMFQGNVKITKGEACSVMIGSTGNLRMVCDLFRQYVRKIHGQNVPSDPNFLQISIACAKIEKFIEHLYPTQLAAHSGTRLSLSQSAAEKEHQDITKKETYLLVLAVVTTLFLVTSLMVFIAWLAGARFDFVYKGLKEGTSAILSSIPGQQPIYRSSEHNEL